MAKLKKENTSFKDLSTVGASETLNAVKVRTAEATAVGVSVEQKGPKKAVSMEVVVPTRRTVNGSRKTTTVRLTGRQARQIYETLRKFYDARSDVEEDTAVNWY